MGGPAPPWALVRDAAGGREVGAAMARPITAEALLPRSPDDVFPYLADLSNHWQLGDRFIEVESLERSADPGADGAATGGRVRIRGPLGFTRTASPASRPSIRPSASPVPLASDPGRPRR